MGASIFFSYFFGVADVIQDSKASLRRAQMGYNEGVRIPNDGGDTLQPRDGVNEHDLEMQALLLSDIGDVGTVGPHSSLSAGLIIVKRVGAGRVQQVVEVFV